MLGKAFWVGYTVVLVAASAVVGAAVVAADDLRAWVEEMRP